MIKYGLIILLFIPVLVSAQPNEYDYIIYKTGNTIYAVGDSISYYGNTTYVLQSVSGHSIYVKSGNYIITKSITLNNYTKLDSDYNTVFIRGYNGSNLFYIPQNQHDISLSDFTVNGNSTYFNAGIGSGKSEIFSWGSNVDMDNLQVFNFKNAGIREIGSGTISNTKIQGNNSTSTYCLQAGYSGNTTRVNIINSELSDCGLNGIYMAGNGKIEGNYIHHNSFSAAGGQIDLVGKKIIVSHNEIPNEGIGNIEIWSGCNIISDNEISPLTMYYDRSNNCTLITDNIG